MKVWDSKKLWKHSLTALVPTAFLVLRGNLDRVQIVVLGRLLGRDQFNQTFRKFWSKTEWIGLFQPKKFPEKQSTFRGLPLFSVGPVEMDRSI